MKLKGSRVLKLLGATALGLSIVAAVLLMPVFGQDQTTTYAMQAKPVRGALCSYLYYKLKYYDGGVKIIQGSNPSCWPKPLMVRKISVPPR